MLKPEVLAILCCPETHQPLDIAAADLLETFSRKLAAGVLKTRDGEPVREVIDGALVRQDGRFAYIMRRGVPVLLIDQAIPL